jgi:hypothetical protein
MSFRNYVTPSGLNISFQISIIISSLRDYSFKNNASGEATRTIPVVNVNT